MVHYPDCCVVGIFGNPRNNPNVKDSRWMTERKYIEHVKLPHQAEMILVDALGNLYEGLTSNLFLVTKDSIICPPLDKILVGTVLLAILDICAKAGITVEMRHPNISEALLWQGAFITSIF
jgi:branched-subunit amino acid aminotransferase/4-amino-4-deoxychorismate lyase